MRALPTLFVLFTLTANAAAADAPIATVTTSPWQEAVVSVTDLDRTARFFHDIGGYEDKWRGPLDADEIASWGLPPEASGEALLLGPANMDSALVRLVRFDGAGRKEPMRPGSHAWDSGCFFSLMVRMKGMPAIFDDAVAMGWWTETPITYLEFGASKLNIMIFKGPDGLQVQGYERLEPPLPREIPPFERLTAPFNVMQIVRDRDATYDFFTRVLGFETFYKGKPYVDEKPTFMPLAIPKNLTTTARYRAGIVYPVAGEFGRMEMIEMMDLEGHDFAGRCKAPNLGILAVRFEVADLARAGALLHERGWPAYQPPTSFTLEPYGRLTAFSVQTPDGAIVQFYAKE